MKTIKRSPLTAAFTLLEIMRSQILIGQDAKIRADFQAISQSLQAYENFNGFLPTTEQGLQALVTPPQSEPKPSHWYQMMKQLPQDPWHSDYVYVCPGKHDPNGFDLYSKGKDKLADTPDDKGNWDFK